MRDVMCGLREGIEFGSLINVRLERGAAGAWECIAGVALGVGLFGLHHSSQQGHGVGDRKTGLAIPGRVQGRCPWVGSSRLHVHVRCILRGHSGAGQRLLCKGPGWCGPRSRAFRGTCCMWSRS